PPSVAWHRYLDRPRQPPADPLDLLWDILRYGSAMAGAAALWTWQFVIIHFRDGPDREGWTGSFLHAAGLAWGLPRTPFLALMGAVTVLLLLGALCAAN